MYAGVHWKATWRKSTADEQWEQKSNGRACLECKLRRKKSVGEWEKDGRAAGVQGGNVYRQGCLCTNTGADSYEAINSLSKQPGPDLQLRREA